MNRYFAHSLGLLLSIATHEAAADVSTDAESLRTQILAKDPAAFAEIIDAISPPLKKPVTSLSADDIAKLSVEDFKRLKDEILNQANKAPSHLVTINGTPYVVGMIKGVTYQLNQYTSEEHYLRVVGTTRLLSEGEIDNAKLYFPELNPHPRDSEFVEYIPADGFGLQVSFKDGKPSTDDYGFGNIPNSYVFLTFQKINGQQ